MDEKCAPSSQDPAIAAKEENSELGGFEGALCGGRDEEVGVGVMENEPLSVCVTDPPPMELLLSWWWWLVVVGGRYSSSMCRTACTLILRLSNR